MGAERGESGDKTKDTRKVPRAEVVDGVWEAPLRSLTDGHGWSSFTILCETEESVTPRVLFAAPIDVKHLTPVKVASNVRVLPSLPRKTAVNREDRH